VKQEVCGRKKCEECEGSETQREWKKGIFECLRVVGWSSENLIRGLKSSL
jgi:hypothetical protein